MLTRNGVSKALGNPNFNQKGPSMKNWIQGAIKKPGALRKSLGVKAGQKIPMSKLSKAAHAPGKMGQRARLAMTLRHMKRGG